MTSDRLPLIAKARLASRIWFWYFRIRARLRAGNIADVVRWLSARGRVPAATLEPARLGDIVARVLPLRYSAATCLYKSLVHFKLLQQQGTAGELVVGLPRSAQTHDAHAWVEVDGVDVGPPPGRLGHTPIARYRAGELPAGPQS